MQGACVESGQLLSEVDVNEETLSELLRCYISTSGNNLEEVSQQSFLRVERYFSTFLMWNSIPIGIASNMVSIPYKHCTVVVMASL